MMGWSGCSVSEKLPPTKEKEFQVKREQRSADVVWSPGLLKFPGTVDG